MPVTRSNRGGVNNAPKAALTPEEETEETTASPASDRRFLPEEDEGSAIGTRDPLPEFGSHAGSDEDASLMMAGDEPITMSAPEVLQEVVGKSPVLDIPVSLPHTVPSVGVQTEMNSATAGTMNALEKGEMVDRFYPYFPGEKVGSLGVVNINEVRYTFAKGRQVRIPRAVAEIYDQRLQVETLNGDVLPSMRIERPNLRIDSQMR